MKWSWVLLLAFCAKNSIAGPPANDIAGLPADGGSPTAIPSERVSDTLAQVRAALTVDPASLYGERTPQAAALPQPAPHAASGPAASIVPPVAGKAIAQPPPCCGPGEFVRRNWGERDKNWLEAVGLYIPRLAFNVLRQTLAGSAAYRLAELARGVGTALSAKDAGDLSKAGYHFADSPINPFGTVEAAISDAGSIVKWLYYSLGTPSSRIQVCTVNLSSAGHEGIYPDHFVDPMKHVAVLIDGHYETRDPSSSANTIKDALRTGAADCRSAPIMSGESESLAIERLMCVDRYRFREDDSYHFFGYNCGGYTKDTLNWSGLGFPIFPNAGIGSDLSFGQAARGAQAFRDKAIRHCDAHIRRIQKAIMALDGREPPDPETKKYFFDNPVYVVYSSDVWLQMLVSAARARNEDNRQWLKMVAKSWWVDFDAYKSTEPGLDGKTIKAGPRPFLQEIFKGVDAQAMNWLIQADPGIAGLKQALENTPAAVGGSWTGD